MSPCLASSFRNSVMASSKFYDHDECEGYTGCSNKVSDRLIRVEHVGEERVKFILGAVSVGGRTSSPWISGAGEPYGSTQNTFLFWSHVRKGTPPSSTTTLDTPITLRLCPFLPPSPTRDETRCPSRNYQPIKSDRNMGCHRLPWQPAHLLFTVRFMVMEEAGRDPEVRGEKAGVRC